MIAGAFLALAASAWRVAWPWYHLHRAAIAESRHQSDLLLYHLGQCLDYWPNNYHVNLMAARVRRRQLDFTGADKHLHVCYKSRGMTEDLEIEWLLLRAIQGQFPEVEQTMQRLVEFGSDAVKPEVLECLTLCYLKELRAGPVQNTITQWLAVDPNNPRAYYWRGMLREKFDDVDGSFEDYNKALEFAPYADPIRLKLVNMLLQKKEFVQAKEHIDRMARDSGDDPEWLIARARWSFHQGELEEAKIYLDKVFAKQPKSVGAAYGLGQVAFESGDIGQAEKWFRRTLELSPEFVLARYSLYLCLSQDPARKKEGLAEVARYREDVKEADLLKKLMQKIDTRAQDIPLLLQAAEKFFKKGERVIGTQYLRRVLRIQPENTQAQELMAKYPLPPPQALGRKDESKSFKDK